MRRQIGVVALMLRNHHSLIHRISNRAAKTASGPSRLIPALPSPELTKPALLIMRRVRRHKGKILFLGISLRQHVLVRTRSLADTATALFTGDLPRGPLFWGAEKQRQAWKNILSSILQRMFELSFLVQIFWQ